MLQPLARDDARRLKDLFQRVGYTSEGLIEKFGFCVPISPDHSDFKRILGALQLDQPLDCLIGWFELGVSLNHSVAAVIPDWFLDICRTCGLLVESSDSNARNQITPGALLTPCPGDFWIAADRLQETSEHSVLPVSDPGLTLMKVLVERPVGRALDLCGGCGLHAVHAAGFADQVVATDLNPRAESFVRFNASLHQRDNVSALTGDMFQPVAGQQFDLIVCHPPFVISPEQRTMMVDGPGTSDGFAQQVVQEAPSFLSEGGFLHVLCEWVETASDCWEDRLRSWTRDLNCDVWVIHANQQSPKSYARGKLSELAYATAANNSRRLQQWLEHFNTLGVSMVHGGLIIMRRRSGTNWFYTSQIAGEINSFVGAAIEKGFANRDFLQQRSDAQLLDSTMAMTANCRLDQRLRWTGQTWKRESSSLSIEEGLPVSIGMDGPSSEIIQRFDGTQTVREILDQLSKDHRVQTSVIETQIVQMTRSLLECGFLTIV